MTQVSVAIATYNGEGYIRAQLESILSQTLQPAEIIVCDDGSGDNTVAILTEYEQQGVLKVYRNSDKPGIIENFKKAVSYCANGNLVALCDQDDVWLPGKLEESVASMNGEETIPAIVFTDLTLVDESLQATAGSFWDILNIDVTKEDLQSLLFGNFITGCTVLMNQPMRHLFAAMPLSGITMHDHWLGLIGYSFGTHSIVTKPQVLYRQHGRNATYETNRRSSFSGWLSKNTNQILSSGNYLKPQLEMAKLFYNLYGSKLTGDQKVIFEEFIALEHKGYFSKKKAALRSRAYRFNDNRRSR